MRLSAGNNTDGIYARSGYARLGPYKAWVAQFSCTSPRAAFFRSQTPMTDIVVATHQTTIPIGTSAHYTRPSLNGNDHDHHNGDANVEVSPDNYDSDIAGSSPLDSELIPTPSDDRILVHDTKPNVHEIGDIEMVDANAIDASIAPPSPAPSGMSQPINNLSLNGVHPSSSATTPSYSAPLSPSSTTPIAQLHERPVENTGVAHRPAKRARTADVAPVSVTLSFPLPYRLSSFVSITGSDGVHNLLLGRRLLAIKFVRSLSCPMSCLIVLLRSLPRPFLLRHLPQRTLHYLLHSSSLRNPLSALSENKRTRPRSTNPLTTWHWGSLIILILSNTPWTFPLSTRSSLPLIPQNMISRPILMLLL